MGVNPSQAKTMSWCLLVFMHPQLIALQPQMGIKVTIPLISLFKVKREANNPNSIMECEIALI